MAKLMQVSFRGHVFLYVNSKYKGQYIPFSQRQDAGSTTEAKTLGRLPGGSQGEHHWIVKSDPLKMAIPFSTLQAKVSFVVSCWMGPGPVAGLQYSWLISIGTQFTWGPFHATVKT